MTISQLRLAPRNERFYEVLGDNPPGTDNWFGQGRFRTLGEARTELRRAVAEFPTLVWAIRRVDQCYMQRHDPKEVRP